MATAIFIQYVEFFMEIGPSRLDYSRALAATTCMEMNRRERSEQKA
jgi:hypothetical protein